MGIGMRAMTRLRVSRSRNAASWTTRTSHSKSPTAAGLSRVHFCQSCFHMGPDLQRRPTLRIELGVPIEIIQPAVVQIVRWEQPPVAVQLMHGGRERVLPREHPRLLRRQIALAQVTRRARRDN